MTVKKYTLIDYICKFTWKLLNINNNYTWTRYFQRRFFLKTGNKKNSITKSFGIIYIYYIYYNSKHSVVSIGS